MSAPSGISDHDTNYSTARTNVIATAGLLPPGETYWYHRTNPSKCGNTLGGLHEVSHSVRPCINCRTATNCTQCHQWTYVTDPQTWPVEAHTDWSAQARNYCPLCVQARYSTSSSTHE
jgi:hypothetical protein